MKTPPTPQIAMDLWHSLSNAWKALCDPNVALWKKGIPILCIVYLIWPMDLINDLIPGLGQIDDLALIIAGLKLFIQLAVDEVPSSSTDEADNPQGHTGETIDGSFRVVN